MHSNATTEAANIVPKVALSGCPPAILLASIGVVVGVAGADAAIESGGGGGGARVQFKRQSIHIGQV